MTDFTFVDGERLVRFGPDALAEAPALLAGRGFDGYVLLTTPRGRSAAPALADAAGTVLDVAAGTVPEAAAAVRPEVRGRPLVALGGGRVIDAAKAIGGADALPVAAVPTTLSGAEMTRFHRMPAGVGEFRFTRPEVVVAEPGLMASQPMPGLAASAMNALAHAMEALYTPLANPVAEGAALRGAADIAGGLADASPDRDRLALGALLAGYACGAAGLAIHHIVCQTIVRTCGTPHAETNAVMLPHHARLMAARAPREMAALSEALGAERDPAAAAGAVAALAARAGPVSLGGLGVGREDLPVIAAAVLQRPDLRNTPDPPGEAELLALLGVAL